VPAKTGLIRCPRQKPFTLASRAAVLACIIGDGAFEATLCRPRDSWARPAILPLNTLRDTGMMQRGLRTIAFICVATLILLNAGCATFDWLMDAEQRKNEWLRETFFGGGSYQANYFAPESAMPFNGP
jgi:hypothetical protein